VPLTDKVVRGSFWILSLRVSNKLLGLARIAILSKLLLPEDFGVVGIAAIAISLVETFTQSGLATALIKKDGEVRSYFDTLWTVSLVRSAFIFGVLFLAAPAVAAFFEVPDAKDIIRVFGISVLIAGCRNPAVIHFQKKLQFSKQYLYEFTVTLVNLMVSVAAAFLLRNAWALVLGGMAGAFARLVMSYWLEPYHPRLQIHKEKLLELFGFGKWIYGTGILYFLIHQGDDLFLGKIYGVAALGLYQMAFTISQLVTTELSQVVSHVTFPALSKIQAQRERLANAYGKVLHLVALLAFPLAGLIFALADELTLVVLSDRWLPIVPMLEILVWAGLLRALKGCTEPLFNAIGRPDVHTKFQLGQLIVLALLILPASKALGTAGICLAVLLSQGASVVLAFVAVTKYLPKPHTKLWNAMIFPAVNTAAMVLVVSLLGEAFRMPIILVVALLTLVGLVVYSVLTYLCDKFLGYNVLSLLGETLSSLVRPGR
jgi:O-antigen/teichoic acid export membrane protein